ncbi:unnamed protein product [Bursaphelenchus xylophilus]|uniref:(pine wood nematode) hypothetical protein n=1 Tax=Bursaphelenchus xylophilus TaxID=6326 RepID=A0A1I7RLK1_BURXY|nr:unnamed protein product [Bursaphelenchus xylophilus]CAG9082902.1 unnamed protein product [Bursaphelenchus xylophilus]
MGSKETNGPENPEDSKKRRLQSDPVKERSRQQKDELEQCFDENKRQSESNIADAERLEEHTRSAKFESRFSKKQRSNEELEKKSTKKMLLKPLVYDYKKHNPEKGKKVEEVKEEDLNGIDNLSIKSLAGSPTVVISPMSSKGTGLKTFSSPGLDPVPLSSSKRRVSKKNGAKLRPRSLPPITQMTINIESVMAGAKPISLKIAKDGTVGTLKKMVRQKMKGVRKFTLSFQGKELAPEERKLSDCGLIDGSSVQIYVSSKTGTVDREEIAKLVKLGQTLSNFKSMVDSIPIPDDIELKPGGELPPEVPPSKLSRELENKKTKEKMAKLKSKLRERSLKNSPEQSLKRPMKVFGRRSDSDGESSAGSVWSDVPESHSEISTNSSDTVTNKEILLYHDPPESRKIMELKENILFDPPASREELAKIREGFSFSCCALCFAKLPLALREMRCRCKKVYCSAHRHPEAHKCAVDLKEVDRQKLDFMKKSPPAKK